MRWVSKTESLSNKAAWLNIAMPPFLQRVLK